MFIKKSAIQHTTISLIILIMAQISAMVSVQAGQRVPDENFVIGRIDAVMTSMMSEASQSSSPNAWLIFVRKKARALRSHLDSELTHAPKTVRDLANSKIDQLVATAGRSGKEFLKNMKSAGKKLPGVGAVIALSEAVPKAANEESGRAHIAGRLAVEVLSSLVGVESTNADTLNVAEFVSQACAGEIQPLAGVTWALSCPSSTSAAGLHASRQVRKIPASIKGHGYSHR